LPDRVTDERLLQQAAEGDEEAFLRLYNRHREPMFRFAYRLLGSVENAEDVVQDCFLSLIKQPERFDPRRALLRTYLYGAIRNLAMKKVRRSGREVAVEEFSEDSSFELPGGPLDRLLDEELSSAVRREVFSLPPLQREALILFEFEELALSEIAEVVGADVGTVKARLHRARQRLKSRLAIYIGSGKEAVAAEKG
jgi:RNA polymerase sigma-70 factor (ECF subfamily)